MTEEKTEKKKAGPGRPRKLDSPKQRAKVLAALRSGVPIFHAGGAAGVTYNTLNNERNRDAEFAAEIETASELGDYKLAVFIEREAKKDGKLALLVAKARLPAYQQGRKVTLDGNVNVLLSADEQRNRISAIAERLGLGDVLNEVPAASANGHSAANGNGNGKAHGP